MTVASTNGRGQPRVPTATAKKQNPAAEQPNVKSIERVPVAPPPFTIADLRRAIPAHCFEKSLLKSGGYVLFDLSLVAIAMYLACSIDPLADKVGGWPGFVLRSALWTVYWVFTGSVFTGLWILAHECGHGAFSNYEYLNDVIGWVLHSALLLPYFSWKISHRRHHSNTGSIDHDEVFVPWVSNDKPPTANGSMKLDMDDMPPLVQFFSDIYRAFRIVSILIIGWWLYLSANLTGNTSYPPKSWPNHFSPSSPIFTSKKEGFQVLLSDIGLLLACTAYYQCCQTFGVAVWFKMFFMSYLVCNAWLIVITYLQHTDKALPHYVSPHWDWLRGALCTIDRDFGIFNHFHHHICDTHIAHHLFSMMPFYHAEEATKAIKPILGKYYRFDSTPISVAMWRNFAECVTVHRDESPKNAGVYWYY